MSIPITITDDKLAIYRKLSKDPFILSLGFEPKNMERTRTTEGQLTAETQSIFIYNIAPATSANDIIARMVYQIDVICPNQKYNTTDKCVEQIISLLDGADLGNMHKMHLLQAPQSISTSVPTLYGVGIRFVVNETRFNKVKTI